MSITRTLMQALLAAGITASGADAQPLLESVQNLDFDRPESWAMKYVASVSAPTGFGVPRALEPGSIEIGLEADWLPSLSAEERTVGFNGSKEEDINRSSFFVRPRVLIGLPAKLSLELGWVPPVELDGVEPNLLSISIGRPLYESRRWRVGLRLLGQEGTVDGDITCSAAEAAAGTDPVANPFFCQEPSNDELSLKTLAAEISAARRFGAFEPYLSYAVSEMDLEFQLDARWGGLVDRTLQKTDGSTWYATFGVLYDGWQRANLAVEAFYTPLDVIRPPLTDARTEELFNIRTVFRYGIR